MRYGISWREICAIELSCNEDEIPRTATPLRNSRRSIPGKNLERLDGHIRISDVLGREVCTGEIHRASRGASMKMKTGIRLSRWEDKLDDSEATGKLITPLDRFHQVMTVFWGLRTVN